MTRARPILVLSVMASLAAAGCGPGPPRSVYEPSTSWQSFTGAAVPANAPVYVSGIHVTGPQSIWLAESWITRGHSHTGLLRSGDNGRTWQQMLGWDGWPLWQRYFDATHAIVVAEFEEGYRLHPRLLSTRDGGQHWSAAELPVTSLYGWSGESVYFVDPSNGWLMVDLSTQFRSCTQPRRGVAVYRTRDGGASWSEIVRLDEQHPKAQGLSIQGGKVGISFRTTADGYITTSDPINGNTVFLTNDGGGTWQMQSLPVAPGQELAFIALPVWVTPNVGLMSVNMSPRPLSACMLGSPSPQTAQPSPSPQPWDVEPPASIVVPYPGALLLVTTDGGHGWAQVKPDPQWGSVTSLAAADAANWSVASMNDLWTTTDGGDSWRVEQSVLKPGCDFGLIGFADRVTGWASALCTEPGPVIEGCPGHADYSSEWDCPPLALPLLSSRDGGATWTEVDEPVLR